MSVKDTARKQYVSLLDNKAKAFVPSRQPPEGWLSVLRKALGMSGADVASRVGVSRNAVYQAERNEREGVITINQMHRMAKAMGGQFVYAIVPDGSVDEIVHEQALRKAERIIRRASAHMALEQQSLSSRDNELRIKELAKELVQNRPADFWDTK